MSMSAIIWFFGFLQAGVLVFVLAKSSRASKFEAAGLTFLGSALVWLALAIFMVVDAKTGMKVAELSSLLKILGAVAGNGLVFYVLYAWSTRRKTN